MTSLTFFLLLLGSWSSIHLIYRLRSPARQSRDLLPISLTPRKRKSTTVTLAGPYLRVESTAFNPGHDTLVQWLSRNRNAGARVVLRSVFDAGIVISLLGTVVALTVLAWTFVQLARRTAADFVSRSPLPADVYPYAKRAYDGNHASPAFTTYKPPDIPVQLLVCTVSFDLIPQPCIVFATTRSRTNPIQIPGITLPLSHLPLLICALFFSQAIHEAGHALSAALFVSRNPPPLSPPLMF